MNENPWHRLPNKPPFVLAEDKDKVLAFNVKERQKAHQNVLNLDLIPEPFVGRPEAPVVLLGNIAGAAAEGDQPPAFKLKSAFADRMRNNLLHTPSSFPFFYLDPDLDTTPLEMEWWPLKLKHLLHEFGNGDVAKSLLARSILAVEFFPYASCSNRYGHDKLPLPSQEYSFGLVRKALKQGSVIVLRHGERRWLKAVPELDGYPHLVRLKEVLKGSITRGNCRDDGFQKIVRAIEKAESSTTSKVAD